MELGFWSVESQGGHEAGGAPRGRGRAPHPRGQGVGPLVLILSPLFFINSKNILREVSGHSENFYFCTKITPWQLVRVSSIQIMQVRVQNKGKSVWKSRYIGDVSLVHALECCIMFISFIRNLKWG